MPESNLLLEYINDNEFTLLLTAMNRIFSKMGITVIFREHFKQRVNDERNEEPITRETFIGTVNSLLKAENSRKLGFMKNGQEGVMIYKGFNFVYTLEKVGSQLQLRFITAMSKKRFKSNSSNDFILRLESFKDFYERTKKNVII